LEDTKAEDSDREEAEMEEGQVHGGEIEDGDVLIVSLKVTWWELWRYKNSEMKMVR
jgi:hypothetical protein